jgi:hypothetical protein
LQEEKVRRELWVSLVGSLRSHLAALEVMKRIQQASLVESQQGFLELQVRADAAILNLRFDPDSGTGIWTLHNGKQSMGGWSLAEDATVTFKQPPQTMDLELAVEHFAAMLLS